MAAQPGQINPVAPTYQDLQDVIDATAGTHSSGGHEFISATTGQAIDNTDVLAALKEMFRDGRHGPPLPNGLDWNAPGTFDACVGALRVIDVQEGPIVPPQTNGFRRQQTELMRSRINNCKKVMIRSMHNINVLPPPPQANKHKAK